MNLLSCLFHSQFFYFLLSAKRYALVELCFFNTCLKTQEFTWSCNRDKISISLSKIFDKMCATKDNFENLQLNIPWYEFSQKSSLFSIFSLSFLIRRLIVFKDFLHTFLLWYQGLGHDIRAYVGALQCSMHTFRYN